MDFEQMSEQDQAAVTELLHSEGSQAWRDRATQVFQSHTLWRDFDRQKVSNYVGSAEGREAAADLLRLADQLTGDAVTEARLLIWYDPLPGEEVPVAILNWHREIAALDEVATAESIEADSLVPAYRSVLVSMAAPRRRAEHWRRRSAKAEGGAGDG